MRTIEQKREANREWHRKNKQRRKEYDEKRSKKYYLDNKQKIIEKRKIYRESEA